MRLICLSLWATSLALALMHDVALAQTDVVAPSPSVPPPSPDIPSPSPTVQPVPNPSPTPPPVPSASPPPPTRPPQPPPSPSPTPVPSGPSPPSPPPSSPSQSPPAPTPSPTPSPPSQSPSVASPSTATAPAAVPDQSPSSELNSGSAPSPSSSSNDGNSPSPSVTNSDPTNGSKTDTVASKTSVDQSTESRPATGGARPQVENGDSASEDGSNNDEGVGVDPSSSQPQNGSSSKNENKKLPLILGIVGGGSVLIALIVIGLYMVRNRRIQEENEGLYRDVELQSDYYVDVKTPITSMSWNGGEQEPQETSNAPAVPASTFAKGSHLSFMMLVNCPRCSTENRVRGEISYCSKCFNPLTAGAIEIARNTTSNNSDSAEDRRTATNEETWHSFESHRASPKPYTLVRPSVPPPELRNSYTPSEFPTEVSENRTNENKSTFLSDGEIDIDFVKQQRKETAGSSYMF